MKTVPVVMPTFAFSRIGRMQSRTLSPQIRAALVRIIRHCQAGEFVRAHDQYIQLAIGNAAWPIGVTMVGIHARSGREKIESAKVAHVMNDEEQRKYLTSIKRLMSFVQSTPSHSAVMLRKVQWSNMTVPLST